MSLLHITFLPSHVIHDPLDRGLAAPTTSCTSSAQQIQSHPHRICAFKNVRLAGTHLVRMTLHVLHDEIGTATSPFGVVLGHVDDDIAVLTFENLQQSPFLHHLQHRNPANALGYRNMNGTKVSPLWTSPRGEFS